MFMSMGQPTYVTLSFGYNNQHPKPYRQLFVFENEITEIQEKLDYRSEMKKA